MRHASFRVAGGALVLELTGLDPRKDVIIAVGAVPIEDGLVHLSQRFYSLVRTSKRSGRAAVLVQKLLVSDLQGAQSHEDVLEHVFELLAGRVPCSTRQRSSGRSSVLWSRGITCAFRTRRTRNCSA